MLRSPDRLQLADGLAIPPGDGCVQHPLVADLFILGEAHGLADGHVGVIVLGVAGGDQQAQAGAPGMAHEVDLLRMEPLLENCGQLVGVGDQLLQGQRFGWDIVCVGLACPALLPGHDHKVFLQIGIVVMQPGCLGRAGTPVQVQEHRVRPVPAADGQPLLHSTDLQALCVGDTTRHGPAIAGTNGRCMGGPQRPETNSESNQGQ